MVEVGFVGKYIIMGGLVVVVVIYICRIILVNIFIGTDVVTIYANARGDDKFYCSFGRKFLSDID